MKRKTGVIEKDFDCIMLQAIADSAVQDATNHLKSDASKDRLWAMRDNLCSVLIKTANECYQAQCSTKSSFKPSGTFYRIKSATEMRDTLYQFMRHWLSSTLQKEHYSLFAELPRGYGWDC